MMRWTRARTNPGCSPATHAAVIALAVFAARASAASPLPAVAVVGVVAGHPTAGDARTASAVVALLESDLSQDRAVRLVDRQTRDRVLQELHLSLTGLADPAAPLRLGRLMAADLTVWAKPATVAGAPALAFYMAECGTGALRGVTVVPLAEHGIAAAVDGAAADLARLAAAPPDAAAPPPAVAVGLFENAGPFERSRPLAFLLRNGVTDALLRRRPAMIVLQRSDLRPLLDELDLARSGLATSTVPAAPRSAAYLLRGTFADVVGSAPPRVRLGMELIDGATGRSVTSRSTEVAVTDLSAVCEEWSGIVGTAVGQRSDATTPPASDEADRLTRLAAADLLRTVGVMPITPADHANDRVLSWGRTAIGQPLHTDLLRQAIERLEAVAFLRPDDLPVRFSLAAALADRDPQTWDPQRAIDLYDSVYRGAPTGPLAVRAAQAIPYERLTLFIRRHDGDTERAATDAYLELARRMDALGAADPVQADDCRERSMQATWEAARWSITYVPKDYGRALNCLRSNAERALAPGRPPGRPREHFQLEYTADSLADVAVGDPSRADACRALLARWAADPSPYLRLCAATAMARLDEQLKDFRAASTAYAAAADQCLAGATVDAFFPAQEPQQRALAARMCLKAGDPAAGLAVVGVVAARVDRGEHVPEVEAIVLGDLYEATGQTDKALAAYAASDVIRNGNTSSFAIDRRNALLRKAGRVTDDGNGEVTYHIRRNGSVQRLAGGGGRVWAISGTRVVWYDPATGSSGESRLPVDARQPRTLACTGRSAFVGTMQAGLWQMPIAGQGGWARVDGLPDVNVTALVPGDRDVLYAAVGTKMSGSGYLTPGGIVAVDPYGHVRPLDGPNAPRVAPDRLAWVGGRVWVNDSVGIRGYDPTRPTDGWVRGYRGPSARVLAGDGRLLALEGMRPHQALVALVPTHTGSLKRVELAAVQGLYAQLAVDSPQGVWLGGRGPGVSETRQLQFVDKATGRVTTLGPEAGKPFTWVEDVLWYAGHTWAATGDGLVEIDAVHAPPDDEPAGERSGKP